ncbi:hypothetical protein ACSSS7_004963 [Eimeria intestinalis]
MSLLPSSLTCLKTLPRNQASAAPQPRLVSPRSPPCDPGARAAPACWSLQRRGTFSISPIAHASAVLTPPAPTLAQQLALRDTTDAAPAPTPAPETPQPPPATTPAPRAFEARATRPHTRAREQLLTASAVLPSLTRALLRGDFLYEHEIGVSLAQHALISEAHSNKLYPLVAHHPRLVSACTVAQDVLLPPHTTTWISAALPCAATPSASGTAPAVRCLTAPDWEPLGLSVPPQMSAGVVEVTNAADTPPHLSAGWPLAKLRSPGIRPALRIVPAHPTPQLRHDPPAHEQIDGGFVPLLPSPNSLEPEELTSLRQLLYEFRRRFNDGSAPLPATNLLTAAGHRRRRAHSHAASPAFSGHAPSEPSTGCRSAPIVMVGKAFGTWRLWCDYRAIDKHVRIQQQLLPRPDDILALFNGKRYSAVLDMCQGFYQIEVAEEDCLKTSFVAADWQRQYRHLSFGFASSPAILQGMFDTLLGGMKWVSSVGYIIDIIVYSDTGPTIAPTSANSSPPYALPTSSAPREVLFRCRIGPRPRPCRLATRRPAVPVESQGHSGHAAPGER